MHSLRCPPNRGKGILCGWAKVREYTIRKPDGRKLIVESDHLPTQAELNELDKKRRLAGTTTLTKLRLAPNDWILLCEQFIKEHPNNEHAWNCLSISLCLPCGVNDPEHARNEDVTGFCRDLLATHPHAMAWRHLDDLAAFQQHRVDDIVIAFCKEFIARDPANSDAWRTLGRIYTRQEKYTEAIPVFEHAIKLNPRDAYAWAPLAYAYASTGQGEKTTEALGQVEKLNAELWAQAKKECEEILREKKPPKEQQDASH